MSELIEVLNGFGRWLVAHLWQMSIELVILAAVVAAAIWLLRVRSPGMRHLFWCVVLAKPVATFLIASPLSLYWFLHPPLIDVAPPGPAPVVYRQAAPVEHPPMRMPPRRPIGTAPPVVAAPGPALDRYGIAATTWLIIGFALGLRLVVGGTYVAFLRRTSMPQRAGPLADPATEVSTALGTGRRVRIAVSEVTHGPVLAGIFRPVILLPGSLTEQLPARHLKHIIAHELAHARRWDNLVLLIQRLAEMLLFFHPVVWVCGRMMRREAEAACDDAVVAGFGASVEYADSLARVAEMRDRLTRRLLVNTFAAAESNLSRRIKRILHDRRARMTLGLTVASVVALIIIACVGLPTASKRTAAHATTSGDSAMSTQTNKLARNVKHEGDKVWIEGVPDMEVGGLPDDWTALIKGVNLLLTHRGEQVTLDELRACAGDAFHLSHGTHWELRTAHAMPTDGLANAAKAYGYEGQWTPAHFFWELKGMDEGQRTRHADEYLGHIRSEIDEGHPVLVGGAYGECSQWRAAVGYDKAADKICYVGGDRPYVWTEVWDKKAKELGLWDAQIRGPLREGFIGGWIGNAAFSLGEKKASPSEAERARMTLRRAVELHRAPPHTTDWHGGVTYYFGQKAYEQWAKDLHELDYPADVAKPRPELPECYDMSLMIYQVNQIIIGRAAAAEFCQNASDALPNVKAHLLAAAQHYREQAETAANTFGAFAAGTEEARTAWLSDETKREAGVAGIRQMLELERAAIAEIENALAAEGIEIPTAQTAPGRASTETRSRTGSGVMPKSESITLKGHTYRIEWVTPDRLAELRLVGDRPAEPRASDWAYGHHAHPLYNIHCEIGPDKPLEELKKQLEQDEKSWGTYWEELARDVLGRDAVFALVAYSGDQLAGHIRFFGADMSRLRMAPDDRYREEKGGLLIGAAYVDPPAADDGLDVELARRVIQYAQEQGRPAIQALGWSDIRAYAMWGESFPVSTYEAVGFRKVREMEAPRDAFEDMLAGAHGPEVQKQVKTALKEHTREAANEFYVMQFDMATFGAGPVTATTSEGAGKPSNAKPDYSKLKLEGHGMAQDSWSLAIQAAARIVGKDADYDTIYALSTNAFAPTIDTGEGCQAWWHMFGRDSGVDIVADRLGLKIEPLALPEGTYTPQDTEEVFERKAAEQRKAAAPILRRAMTEGRMLLTTYGWRVHTDHGFVPWCWWGIITDVQPDGAIVGAQLNGRLDNPLDFVDTCYAVSTKEPSLGRRDADLMMLKRAIERIRGRKPEAHGRHLKLGLDAMDVWIRQMATVRYFCPECEERTQDDPDRGGFRCAASNAQSMMNGSRVAASYLRRIKSTLGTEAERHLEQSAEHYEYIADLLNPAITGEGGDHYKAICGDLDKQRAHAKVLEQVKVALAAAADAMEQALAAEGIEVTATVAPALDGSNVMTGKQLDGLKRSPVWMTHMGCLIDCAAYLEVDASPAWIYGGSGHAFALNIHEVICPSGPTAWAAEKCNKLAANVGLQVEDLSAYKTDEDVAAKRQAIWQKVKAAIDAGHPAFGWELDIPEWYLISGYDDDGNYLFVNFDETVKRKHHGALGESGIGVTAACIVKPTKAADDRTVVREVIAFALEHGAGKDSHEVYRTGLAGYDLWIKTLEDNKAIGFGQAYNGVCWAECRRYAVQFLEEAKRRLDDEELSPRFDEAIGHYTIVAAKLTELADIFPFEPGKDEAMDERMKDASRRQRALAAVRAARAAEAEGLKALADLAAGL